MRYLWLDGLRGLAALYVVLHHATAEVPSQKMHWLAARLVQWLSHGHFAVSVFIVVSGYSLMLPVARDPEHRLRGGTLAYIGRRARRILPPYYAALAISLLLIANVPWLREPMGSRWDVAIPAFDSGTLASHLLLYHNVSVDWLWKINPPFWSVATEWQIYFLFPALLAAWRRWGNAATIGIAYAVAYLFEIVVGSNNYQWMCPWFAGAFAIGMAAVPAPAGERRPGPAWGGRLAVVGCVAALCLGSDTILFDTIIAGATAALLAFCAAREGAAGPRPVAIRILESPAAAGLGAYSYSLYLLHYPVLSFVSNLLMSKGFEPMTRLAMVLVYAVPLALFVSYLFHRCFERPFMPGHPRTATGAARAALVSPAP